MTREVTSEDLPDIEHWRCQIRNHPDARTFLQYLLAAQFKLVRSRRIWGDAIQRCAESLDFVGPDQWEKFNLRMTREPFAFGILTKMLCDEYEMVALADCSEFLERFEAKFPE